MVKKARATALMTAGMITALAAIGGTTPAQAAALPQAQLGMQNGDTGEYLVSVSGDADDVRRDIAAAGGQVEDVFPAIDVLAVTLPVGAAGGLDARSGVEVVPNFTLHAATDTLSPSFGIDRIDQRSLPLTGYYERPGTGLGEGVRVYVMDSGIRFDHREFAGRVEAGYSAIDDGGGTDDCRGHGTHVSGTAAGQTVGVAPLATVVPVRVLDCTGVSTGFQFLEGLEWVLNDHEHGEPAVINLSLAAPASEFLDDAMAAAVEDGIVVVAAAGNQTADACAVSPARAESVISVAASTSTDARAAYSNHGPCVDIFAPGGDGAAPIWSSHHTSSSALEASAGTSMATAHVTGAAARYLSSFPAASPLQVEEALLSASTPDVIDDAGAGSPNRLLYVGGGNEVPAVVIDPPTVPTKIPFTDIAGHPFEKEIAWVGESGISRGWVTGENGYEFRPRQKVSRGEMALFLYRLAGEPVFTPPPTSPFIDVTPRHDFYKQISWLAQTGIANSWDTGYGPEYRAESVTTRGAMAAFLHRFAGSPTQVGPSPFRDAQPGVAFYDEIRWMASEGISRGWDVGSGCREYRAGYNVLRSDMAAFLYRMENGGTPVVDGACSPMP